MVLKVHWLYFRFLKIYDLSYSASRSDSRIRPLAVVLVTVIGGLGGLDAAFAAAGALIGGRCGSG
jgi:hypothetical protein